MALTAALAVTIWAGFSISGMFTAPDLSKAERAVLAFHKSGEHNRSSLDSKGGYVIALSIAAAKLDYVQWTHPLNKLFDKRGGSYMLDDAECHVDPIRNEDRLLSAVAGGGYMTLQAGFLAGLGPMKGVPVTLARAFALIHELGHCEDDSDRSKDGGAYSERMADAYATLVMSRLGLAEQSDIVKRWSAVRKIADQAGDSIYRNTGKAVDIAEATFKANPHLKDADVQTLVKLAARIAEASDPARRQ